MAFSTLSVYKLLFQSGTFMIKSVQIETQTDLTGRLSAELSSLKGQLIFAISRGKIETTLLNKHPEIRELHLKRHFPDRLSVDYSLREPLASLETTGGFQALDSEAKSFPFLPSMSQAASHLPEVAVEHPQSVIPAVAFIQSWNKQTSGNSSGQNSLKKVTVDDLDEITAEIADSPDSAHRLRLIWGKYEPENFSEKFLRTTQVENDLKEKQISAQAINVKGVPQGENSILEGRRTIGRAVVSLARR